MNADDFYARKKSGEFGAIDVTGARTGVKVDRFVVAQLVCTSKPARGSPAGGIELCAV